MSTTETPTWKRGDRCQVSIPYGKDDKSVHLGTVISVRDEGPYHTHRSIKVRFDDPLLYGGTGLIWISPGVLTKPGEAPAEPERTSV